MPAKLDKFIHAYWPVILGLVAICVAWGVSTAQIAAIGKGQDAMSLKQDLMSAKLDTISNIVTATEVSATFATRDIGELRARMQAFEQQRR